jgi:hypothetical protein
MHAPPLTSCRTWITAVERTARQERNRKAFTAFWGRDYCRTWSKRFDAHVGGATVSLKVYIYPTIQISWYVQVGERGCTSGGQNGIDYQFVDLTVRETEQLAAELRLDVADWLAGALEVCGCDRVRDAWRLG